MLPMEDAPVVLFCHGFPGIHQHEDLAAAVHRAGMAVVLLKYRGVGESTGLFTFRDAITDVKSAIDYLVDSGIGSAGIGLFGYSAGGYYGINATVSCNTGVSPDRRSIRAICVLSPLVDLPRTARLKFENIYQLMLSAHTLIRIAGVDHLVASFAEIWRDYHVLERVSMLDGVPILIIDGDDKEHGDPEQASMLYTAAKEPKTLLTVPGAGHYFDQSEERARLEHEIVHFFARELIEAVIK